MEKTINKVLFKHQESILFNIGLIVLVPFVCTIAILIKNGTDASYVKAFFGLLVFGYIYPFQ